MHTVRISWTGIFESGEIEGMETCPRCGGPGGYWLNLCMTCNREAYLDTRPVVYGEAQKPEAEKS